MGLPRQGTEINNTPVVAGGTVELQPGVGVPAQFYDDPGVNLGWASTGGGSFACTSCYQTTFTPSSNNGTIFPSYEDGTANWGGYFLLGDDSSGNGDYTFVQAQISIPSEASFTGPSGSEVSYWIGLGGEQDYDPYPFFQAGVDVTLPDTIDLWYEGFVSSSNYQTEIQVTSPIAFGDTFTVEISYVSGGGYACFWVIHWNDCYTDPLLAGDTTGATADWIGEAPLVSAGGPEAILPDYPWMTFNKMEASPTAGFLEQISLQTCFGGFSCGDSGQTMTPGYFNTGDFTQGFNTTYTGST
jgi:hypothetical protein